MSAFRKIKWRHYIAYIVIALFTVVAGVLSLAGSVPASYLYLFEKIAISMILAVSLNLVVGFLGELSLGHAGFMCVGAYLGGWVSEFLSGSLGDSNPLNLLISMIVGALCAALCGLLIGLPALRLKGDYLAIVTLAFGEIVRVIFKNSSSSTFGGALGLGTPRYDKSMLFVFAFLMVLLCLCVIQNLMRSKHGRAITAIRDSEIAARATGVHVTKYKLIAFMVSAAFAGIAGVLYSFSNYKVQFEHFDYNYSIEILVMIVLGGLGSINGSLISAALVTFLDLKLAEILTGDLAVLQNLVYALILIVVVIYGNAPALRGFREKYHLNVLLANHRKKKPDASVIRDDAASWAQIPTKIPMDEILSNDFTGNQPEAKMDNREEK